MRKRYFSKIVSFAISSMMILSSFANVFANSETTYYYNEDFSGYATNLSIDTITTTAKSGIVAENAEKNNKYLALSGSAVSAAVPVSASINNLFISFDISVPKANAETQIFVKSGSAEIKLLSIDNTGTLKDYNGKEIGFVGKGKLKNIAVSLSGLYNRYTVYINEKQAAAGIYVRGDYPKDSISAIKVSSTFDEEGELLLDNIYVYKSSKLISNKNHKKSLEYNDDELVVLENDYEFTADTTVYRYSTFDSGWEHLGTAFQAYPNDNRIDWVKESDNGYVKMEKTSERDCMIDFYAFPETTGRVVRMDLKSPKLTQVRFDAVGQNGQKATVMRLENGGNLTCNGNVIGKLKKNQWTKFVWVMSIDDKTVDFYINDELVADDAPMPSNTVDKITMFRVFLESTGTLMLDNYIANRGHIYRDYDALFDETSNEVTLHYTYDDAVAKKLSEINAVNIKTGVMSVGGVRSECSVMPFEKDGKLMLSKKDALALVGASGASDEIVALEDVADEYNKIVTKNETSTVYVSDEELHLTDKAFLAINASFVYDRPEISELKELFVTDEHPRLHINKEKLAEIKNNYGKEENITKWVDYLVYEADKTLELEPEVVSTEGYYDILRISARYRERVEMTAFAYLVTGDKKYADKAWQFVENACNYPNWNHNVHTLDSTTFLEASALGYDWLYDYLTPEQRKFIIDSSHKHILDAVKLTYHNRLGFDHEWPRIGNNWNTSCNYTIMAAASVFFEENPDLYADYIMCALRLYENMLGGYYPSGGWEEGPGYGMGVMNHVAKTINLMNMNFGTDFGISKTPSYDIAPDFFIGISGTEGTNNFNDSDTSAGITAPTNFYLSKIYNKPEVAATRIFEMYRDDIAPTWADVAFYEPSMNVKGIENKLDYYFPGLEMVGMHSSYEDPTATFVSFHTGDNLDSPYHNHVDSGTFVIDMLGERFVKDMGAENYQNPGTQDIYRQPTKDLVTRYSYYMNRAEGHSTLVINPDFSAGQNLRTDDKIEEFVSKPRGAYAISSMADAYEGYAKDVRRGIMMTDDRRSVTIRDEIKLNAGNNEVWWFMHTQPNATIEILDPNTATIEVNGQKVKVMLYTNAAGYEMKEMAPIYLTGVDPGGDRVGYYDVNTRGKKLAVKMNATGDLNIQVKVIPMSDPYAELPMEIVALDNWSIADGEPEQIPLASGMAVNGQNFADFKPMAAAFNVPLAYAQKDIIPDITLKTDDGIVSELVHKAENILDATTIKVYRASNPKLYRIYTIRFYIDLATTEQFKHNIVSVEASAEPQPENPKTGAIDGDLSTRWSADGNGQWITLDLGQSKYIENIGLAFMSGSARQTYYKLYISNDNTNWELIYDGASSGTTDSIELSPAINKNARYIKFEGFGNTQNTWNSVTEFAAYSTK